MRLDSRDGEPVTDRPGRRLRLMLDRPGLVLTWTRHAAGQPGTSLHLHREHTDAFLPLAGALTILVGTAGEPVVAEAGTLVVVPPGVVHAFVNGSGADVAWLNVHAPNGGFASYLRDDGAPWDSHDPPAEGDGRAGDAEVHADGRSVLRERFGVEVVEGGLEGAVVELR
jgi:mannose-6-phosphate isomerase-like protein (cupin superfamily)